MKTILTKKVLVAITVSTSVLLINLSSNAEIYKWTDAKGVTHYTAQKPTTQKIKSEDIGDKIRSAAGKYRVSSQQVTQADAQSATESKDKKKNVKLSGPSAKLVSYCKNQRKNLATLKKNYRNVWKGQDGKEARLNQKQRQDKVNKIQKSITAECEGV